MSMYSSKRRSRQASRSQLGHLKLSVYEEASTLIIHIIEARGLLRKDSASYDTYVKIYLLPDPQKQSKEKTKIVKSQKDPVFNEKFSILLSESDQEKKLFISVWTHSFAARNEMIGCMTFLISDLVGPNKALNGWYRLLDATKGKTENVQVPNSITKYSAQVDIAQQPGEHRVFAVTLVKGTSGYGFSVHGHNPVYVTEVIEGLPAAESDIRVGDIIMEVESTDVTRANGDLVVSIVKKCTNTLQLILRRPLTSIVAAATTAQKPPLHPRSSRQQSQSFGSSLRVRSMSSNAISLSQQDEPLGFGTLGGGRQYSSASQYLAPETHDYRRLSAHFPPDLGLTQPVSAYGEAVGSSSRLEPDPYVRNTYSHRRKHRSRSSSRNRIPEESRPDGGGPNNSISGSRDRLKVKDDAGGRWSGQQTFSGGASRSVSNLSSSSRPPRYSSHRNHMGSQEHLMQTSGYSAQHRGSFDGIDPAVPGYAAGQALTQPIYPEEGETNMEIGWSRGGGATQPPAAAKSSRKLKVVEAVSKEQESKQGGERNVRRTVSLSPPHIVVEGEESTPTVKTNGEVGGAMATAMATGSTHHPAAPSSGSCSENQIAKAISNHEEVPIVWENLGSLEQTRQKAMNKLLDAESAFCEELAVGVETYVDPLRSILSESIHTTMFLGLAELKTIAQEISFELKARKMPYATECPLPFYIPRVADIYWPRLDRLVSGLETYIGNWFKARQEIGIAFTNEEFTKHVQDAVVDKKRPTIYSFVEAGKEYFPKLCKALMALVYYTPVFHKDQKHLSSIVDAILKLSSDKELVKKWEEDQEAMKGMQIRVGFNNKVRPIVVRVPGRMLLREAEVTIIEKRKKKKVWLLLFSDMLLVTRRQGKLITTIEEPVFLENLVVQDINCEATEFQIQTADGSYSRLMRVSSESEKKEWMEMLKERATGSLANRRRISATLATGGDSSRDLNVRQALVLQSKQLLAATLAVDEPDPTLSSVTPLSEKGATGSSMAIAGERGGGEEGGEDEDMERRTSTLGRRKKKGSSGKQKGAASMDDSQLMRGTSKRRSLFNLGGGGRRNAASPTTPKKKKSQQISADKKSKLEKIGVEKLKEWEVSFSAMLDSPDGMELFEDFLKSEFSDENIQFWKACERFKTLPEHSLEKEADKMFEEYISPHAPKMVNLDYQTTQEVKSNLKNPDKDAFSKAQHSIYLLMARDSFVRFVKSEPFQQALKR